MTTSLMRTGSVISPSSSTSRSLSLDSPNSWKNREYIPRALSSLRSDGTPKTRTIAIGVLAHKTLQNEPFAYVFNHLVERICCKVVVICCLSRIRDEMGVNHPVDVEHFTGISKKKLDLAVTQQINNLNYFLRSFREQLTLKGVQLEIQIATGPKSHDILVEAAKAVVPHWVVLDRSFGGHQKKIYGALECNLVLMKRGASIESLIDADKFLGEPISEEGPEVPATPTYGSRTPSTATPIARSTTLQQALQIDADMHETTTTQKVFSCFSCIFSRGAPVVETDGPTRKRTVMYGDTGPGYQAQYLGSLGHRLSSSEDFSLYSSGSVSSPSASVSSPFFSLTNRSITITKTTARRKSKKILEAEMEAQMQMALEEEDEPYLLQL